MKLRKLYTPEFKIQALELMATGKPVPELARELGLSTNLLYNWRAGAQIPQVGSAGPRAGGEQSEADELRDLRRDYARLQMENDILKKAAVILGTRLPSSSGK
jgi:transposase